MTHTQDFMKALNDAAIITETDLNGTIVSVNELFCKISGYSEAELVGAPHNLVNSGVHPKEFFAEMWETISSGKTWCGEVCNRRKDGYFYWVQATVFPVLSIETNEIYRYISVRVDITEKKQRELSIAHQAAQYKAVIESTDGFCRIDYLGKFLEVSDGYCRITGYSRKRLLNGMHIFDMGVAEDLSSQILTMQYLTESNGSLFETTCRRKNGSTWTAEISASYSKLNDSCLFVFFRDISDRKNIEERNQILNEQLNQMQKIDSIGRLTAGIAHDFNNILASILGYNEFNQDVGDDMPEGPLKQELNRNVEQIKMAADRAVELINKMLTYTRQKAPRKVKETKPTAQIVEEVVNMLRSGITSKYQIELDLDASLNIDIDAIDMHQVMTNLLVNARDAMRSKGNGTIKVKLQMAYNVNSICNACIMHVMGDVVELSVTDTGMGMDEQTIRHIFDPFFTTKAVGEGTGLGLSVVKGIVCDAGGHFFIESELGKGTTFKLVFPIEQDSILL
jgi:PAS domain S-box-containing protein